MPHNHFGPVHGKEVQLSCSPSLEECAVGTDYRGQSGRQSGIRSIELLVRAKNMITVLRYKNRVDTSESFHRA